MILLRIKDRNFFFKMNNISSFKIFTQNLLLIDTKMEL